MIKVATLNDLPTLLKLAQRHISESDWNYTYNENKAIASFVKYIESKESDVLLLGDKGLAIIAYDDEFHDERLGYIMKFFIDPTVKGAGRQLMDACDAWLEIHGTQEDVATDSFGPKGNKLFKNLMAKYDFFPSGEVLTRRKKHVQA